MTESVSNVSSQALTRDLLKVFLDICEKNGLRYFFTGGALIGVLRHKGFIPWDDDIDIAMPRPDYQKFVQLVKELPPAEGYGICDRHSDPQWHFAMCQFVDEESEVEIHLAKETRRAHIWIDVFPLDGLPSSGLSRWLRMQHILVLRYLVQLAYIDEQVDAQRARPLIERLVLAVASGLRVGKLLRADKLLDRLDRTLQKMDYDGADYSGNLLGRYRMREVVPKAFFGSPQQALFEGIPVAIPELSDQLQRHLYGDYMALPPVEQRVAHNVTILQARTSAREEA